MNNYQDFSDQQLIKSLFLLKIIDRKKIYEEILTRIKAKTFQITGQDYVLFYQSSRLIFESSKVLSSKLVKEILLNSNDDAPYVQK